MYLVTCNPTLKPSTSLISCRRFIYVAEHPVVIEDRNEKEVQHLQSQMMNLKQEREKLMDNYSALNKSILANLDFWIPYLLKTENTSRITIENTSKCDPFHQPTIGVQAMATWSSFAVGVFFSTSTSLCWWFVVSVPADMLYQKGLLLVSDAIEWWYVFICLSCLS